MSKNFFVFLEQLYVCFFFLRIYLVKIAFITEKNMIDNIHTIIAIFQNIPRDLIFQQVY